MTNGTLDLARITFDLEETPVIVIAKKDMPDLRIDRIHIRLINDQETEVPLWIAEVLQDKNMVTIKRDQAVSYGYIARVAHREGESRALEPIDSLLFRRVKTEIQRLKEINTSTSLRQVTSIEGNFNKLLRLRYKKLLNITMLDNQLADNLELSEEEKWLYSKLNEVFNAWQGNAGLASEEIK